MLGAFRDNARTRMEFLELVKLSGAALNLRERSACRAWLVSSKSNGRTVRYWYA